MEPHDIYFFLGGFLPLIGLIGYFTARAEMTPIWFPLLLLLLGLGSMAMAWDKADGDLSLTGFGDSTLRIIAAIL